MREKVETYHEWALEEILEPARADGEVEVVAVEVPAAVVDGNVVEKGRVVVSGK